MIALREATPPEDLFIKGLDACDESSNQHGDLVEDLVMVPLEEGNKERSVCIKSYLDEVTKYHLIVTFLQKHTNGFGWPAADMADKDFEMMTHQLNVDFRYRSIK